MSEKEIQRVMREQELSHGEAAIWVDLAAGGTGDEIEPDTKSFLEQVAYKMGES